MVVAYGQLHELGFAHSFEAWEGEALVGGLYGVSLGAAFFGESMFHRETDASKVALVALVAMLIFGMRHPVALVGFTSIAFVGANIVVEFVMGVLARRRSTGEKPLAALVNLVSRDHRRYGGLIVHLSILLITLGVVGSAAYKSERQVALQPGEQVEVDGVSRFPAGLRVAG